MELKKEELLVLNSVLNNIVKNNMSSVRCTKLSYALMKNIRLISSEIEVIREALKQPEVPPEIEKTRQDICRTNCVKDEHGNPKLTPQNEFVFDSPETKALVEKAVTDIPGFVEFNLQIQDKVNQNNEFLKELVEIPELHKIKQQDLPSDLPHEIIASLMQFSFELIQEG